LYLESKDGLPEEHLSLMLLGTLHSLF